MTRPRNTEPWPETARLVRPEDLSAPATQLVADRDIYLGQGRHDVGRRIADDQVELFISGDVASALQGEFEQHASEFVAVHDVGTSASLRLLGSLAGAAGARVQRLSVRRQGQGMALAVIQFVEVPLADRSLVRVYSTDLSGDSQARQQVARVLLGWSRLGVLMVGELPAHVLTASLKPLHEALMRGPWPNREMLLVPLGSGTALAAQAAQLSGASRVAVHVTPRAAKPKHAWTYIGGAWNRLQGPHGAGRAMQTELDRAVPRPAVPDAEAPTQPMGLGPIADPGARSARRAPAPADSPLPVPGATGWHEYARRCATIPGLLACCIFDAHTTQVLGQCGTAPGAERLAQQGAALLTEMRDAARALGLDARQPEAVITTGPHHQLLRHLPGHPGVALHMVLQAERSNPAAALAQLSRIPLPG